MRTLLRALTCFVIAAGLSGCAVRNCCQVTSTGRLADTPAGPTAVLRVTSGVRGEGAAHGYTVARVDTPNAPGQFAELLAHAAREDAGLDVILPYQVQDRLIKAKLAPTLEPTQEELAQQIEALGCASYLEASVERWRSGYLFFIASAEITFRVACRRPDGSLIWEAHVHGQQRNVGDRDIARLALYEGFRHMAVEQVDDP